MGVGYQLVADAHNVSIVSKACPDLIYFERFLIILKFSIAVVPYF